MGGIPGGRKVGDKILDATKADVVAAAKGTAPVKMAEQIKKGLDAAKKYRSQLRSQGKGTGAKEGSGFDYQKYKLKQGEKLGDFGEDIARDYYKSQGYDEFYAVQNKSGNGVDIVARNSKTGDMVKAEVKTTQQEKLWNGGDTKEIPMSKDQKQMGGKRYTDDRLNRAAKGDDGYTDGRSTEQAEMALEAQREAINNGAEVKTEKIDIYVDKNGTLRGKPQIRKW